MLTSIVVRGVDAQTADYLNNKGCPLAQGVNRRLKKGYHCMAYINAVHIYDGLETKLYESVLPKNFGSQDYQEIRKSGKNIIVKVEIPNQYLKRVHKPRVKKVVAPVAPVAAPVPVQDEQMDSITLVRKVADILDKLYPNWINADFNNMNMSSPWSCAASRIGKAVGITKMPYSTISDAVEKVWYDGFKAFTSDARPEDWVLVQTERKEAAKPKFDRPRHAAAMREVAKILDKVFPNWRGVDLTFLSMDSVYDCLLQRIAKMHGLEGVSYNGMIRFMGIHGYDGVLFCSNTTPHDWAIIIAEGKQD
jgi:hypothetical protein